MDYAEKVKKTLKSKDIRCKMDDRSEKIGKKIRDAELSKTPFMIIIGAKEEENNEVSVRIQGEGDQGSISLEKFAEQLVEASKLDLLLQ